LDHEVYTFQLQKKMTSPVMEMQMVTLLLVVARGRR
jgi:hypothetical protein